jgi:hypothetical protein
MGENDGEPISQEIKDCIDGAYEAGRAAALRDVVAWLRANVRHEHTGRLADAIERGDVPRGEP